MKTRRVFIGSSTPALDIARAVASILTTSHGLDCTLWPDAFPPGSYTFASLERAAAEHGFAVFIAQADDLVSSDGSSFRATRPNVVGEYFLFAGRNTTERTYMLVPSDEKPALPTDLDGLVWVGFSASQFAVDPSGALLASCLKLARRMAEVHAADEAKLRAEEAEILRTTHTTYVEELYLSAAVLREVVDAVQRDTLARLLDESEFDGVKRSAVARLIALSQAQENRATAVGVAGQYHALRESLTAAILALPFPSDVTRSLADLQQLANRSAFATLPAFAEAIRNGDIPTILSLGATLKDRLTIDEIAAASAELVTARLSRLQDSYSRWWKACSRTVNKSLTEFQHALLRAQTRHAIREVRQLHAAPATAVPEKVG